MCGYFVDMTLLGCCYTTAILVWFRPLPCGARPFTPTAYDNCGKCRWMRRYRMRCRLRWRNLCLYVMPPSSLQHARFLPCCLRNIECPEIDMCGCFVDLTLLVWLFYCCYFEMVSTCAVRGAPVHANYIRQLRGNAENCDARGCGANCTGLKCAST